MDPIFIKRIETIMKKELVQFDEERLVELAIKKYKDENDLTLINICSSFPYLKEENKLKFYLLVSELYEKNNYFFQLRKIYIDLQQDISDKKIEVNKDVLKIYEKYVNSLKEISPFETLKICENVVTSTDKSIEGLEFFDNLLEEMKQRYQDYQKSVKEKKEEKNKEEPEEESLENQEKKDDDQEGKEMRESITIKGGKNLFRDSQVNYIRSGSQASYIINKSWYEKAQSYLKGEADNKEDFPCEIDNLSLLSTDDCWEKKNGSKEYQLFLLNTKLNEGEDYLNLSEEEWKSLKDVFGATHILKVENLNPEKKIKILILNEKLREKEMSDIILQPKYLVIDAYSSLKQFKDAINDVINMLNIYEEDDLQFEEPKINIFVVPKKENQPKQKNSLLFDVQISYINKIPSYSVSSNDLIELKAGDDDFFDDLPNISDNEEVEIIVEYFLGSEGNSFFKIYSDGYCYVCKKLLNSSNVLKCPKCINENSTQIYCSRKCCKDDVNHLKSYHEMLYPFQTSIYNFIGLIAETETEVINSWKKLDTYSFEQKDNNCYFTAGLQCLLRCTFLTNYFNSKLFEKENLLKDSGTEYELCLEYSKFVQKLCASSFGDTSFNKKEKSIRGDYSKLFELLASVKKKYDNKNQHDSSELMVDFLNTLLEGVKRKSKSEKENSIINDLFYGESLNQYTCNTCGLTKEQKENFLLISLPIIVNKNSIEYKCKLFENKSRKYSDKYFVPEDLNSREVTVVKFRLNDLSFKVIKSVDELKTQSTKNSQPGLDNHQREEIVLYKHKSKTPGGNSGKLSFFIFPVYVREGSRNCLGFLCGGEVQKEERILDYPILITMKNNDSLETLINEANNIFKGFLSSNKEKKKSSDKSITLNLCIKKKEKNINTFQSLAGIHGAEEKLAAVFTEEMNQKKEFIVLYFRADEIPGIEKKEFVPTENEVIRKASSTINNCLDHYMSNHGTFPCSQCKRQCELSMKFTKIPIYLMFHFQRFCRDENNNIKKIDVPIKYGEIFDLAPYMEKSLKTMEEEERESERKPQTKPPSIDEVKYELIAVNEHKGTIESGHNFAYIKHGECNWYLCDGEEIKLQPRYGFYRSEALVLIYKLVTGYKPE